LPILRPPLFPYTTLFRSSTCPAARRSCSCRRSSSESRPQLVDAGQNLCGRRELLRPRPVEPLLAQLGRAVHDEARARAERVVDDLDVPLRVDVVQERPHHLLEVARVAAVVDDGDQPYPAGGRLARRPLAQVPALAGPGLARGDEPEAASELVLVGDLGVVGEVLAAALRVRLERLVAALLGVLDRAVDD